MTRLADPPEHIRLSSHSFLQVLPSHPASLILRQVLHGITHSLVSSECPMLHQTDLIHFHIDGYIIQTCHGVV